MKFKGFKNLLTIGLSVGIMFGGFTSIARASTVGVPTSIKLIPTSNGRLSISFNRGAGSVLTKTLMTGGGDSPCSFYVDYAQKKVTQVYTDLLPNSVYHFFCLSSNGRGSYSRNVETSVRTAPSAPYAPTKAKVYKYNNKIKLVWTRAAGVSGYEVYRSTSYRGKYTMVARTPNSSFVNSVAKGHYYYYKVRSFKATYYTRVYSNAWSNLTCIRF